ncbi:phosphotransferase [Patescibacteria group bacterium]|nr:phosphotransferase [Patescibacteria group bacterium]MBU1673686.1 phosphotransferase [Patescibacteria group bacterium]MBU1963496.1 phosphotransferase [Patescibacteria group bacterium]
MTSAKNIEVILKKHGLTADHYKKSLSGRFYSFPAQNKSGEHFFMKIRNDKTLKAKKEITKEVEVTMRTGQALNKRPDVLHTMHVIGGQTKVAPEWFIYEFVKGTSPGDALSGYNKDFLTKNNLKKVVKTWQLIQAIDVSDLDLSSRKFDWFDRQFNRYTKKIPKSFFLPKSLINKSVKYLAENKTIINKAPLVLNHGDMFPQNLIQDNSKFSIIDWGMAHLNNQAFDLATIWFNAWQSQSWQKELLKSLPQDEIFQACFRAVAIRQTMMIMSIYGNIYDHPEKWRRRPPRNEVKYFTSVKPLVQRAFEAHSKNLEDLLA